jgi:hypothetical protein
MFLRAPGLKTAPGEPVDLGEIGACAEKNWIRRTPYSPAQPWVTRLMAIQRNTAVSETIVRASGGYHFRLPTSAMRLKIFSVSNDQE